jgi:CRISPR-associated endonuclease/helicase Cas3
LLTALSRGDADGIYVALPTAATANGLYDRLSRAYRSLFDQAGMPSLVLAHGSRHVHDGFQQSILRLSGMNEDPASGDDEIPSGAACAAYIADERRLTFLADVGVGTIDQALMGILPVRYQALRMLGMFRKVLILDEIHAYDAYMSREIEELLRFQGALGAPVVLLSATLPASLRSRLEAAFLSRRPASPHGLEPQMTAYPAVTVASRTAGTSTTSVKPDLDRARSVSVRLTHDIHDVRMRIEQVLASGGCVAWIRNTVGDVLEAAEFLGRHDPLVFHSRFAQIDRTRIETEIKRLFGPKSTRTDRAGRLVVASQVIEQSLDLDFDLIVTDLAPIDLIIQRAGRLWRHERGWRTGSPELVVVSPSLDQVESGWYSNFFRRAGYVYRDDGILWRTATLLEAHGRIRSPDDLCDMVEAVYGPAAEPIPESLVASTLRAEGKNRTDRGGAGRAVLRVHDGYDALSHSWDGDIEAFARLIEDPAVRVRLATHQGDRLYPWGASATASMKDWAAAELAIPSRMFAENVLAPDEARLVTALQSSWNRFDRDIPVALIHSEGAEHRLSIRSNRGTLLYRPDRGLLET